MPVTDNHYLLPLNKHRDAPSTRLSSHAGYEELEQFLEFYDKLCVHYEITSSGEKCKGLVGYCAPKVAKMIKKLPSYIRGNYDRLVADLKYFMEGEDDSYNLTKINHFTRKWRKRPIDSLEKFKRYHRKYLELVGRAIGMETIDRNEYNRHFWEGLHQTLRQKIESRLLVKDPRLNVSIPFDMEKVTEAALDIFNPRRFDQHLFNGSDSETDSDKEKYRPTRRRSESDEDQDSESEESDTPRRRSTRKLQSPTFPSKVSQKHKPSPSKKSEKDEIAKLTEQMSQLKLFFMKNDANFQEDDRPKRERPGRSSYPPNNQQQRNFSQYPRPPYGNQPPQYNRSMPQTNPQQQTQSQPQFVNASYNQSQQRDVQPHGNQNQPSGPPSQSPYCFGCGQTGHHIAQCVEINTFLNQGTVMRNDQGRLCWADGSYIYKNRNETLAQAIQKALKQANIVRAQIQDPSMEESYYHLETTREDSDASSEEQEELGWLPGSVADCYAAGADRSSRVSREARKEVQFNVPSHTQRMKKLSENRNMVDARKQVPPVRHSSNLNGNQFGNPKRPIPFDVDQNKFEGKDNSQFLPMEIDQSLAKVPGHEEPKVTTNQPRSDPLKSTNGGTIPEKVSSGIVQEMMHRDVTVPLGSLLEISPLVRRTFVDAMKVPRVGARQTQDQKEKNEKGEKSVLRSELLQPSPPDTEIVIPETRETLLAIKAKVGQLTLTGILDSGSQVSIISQAHAKACRIPIQIEGLERVKISGINGSTVKCVGITPEIPIYITGNQLETFGQLYVLADTSFTLILGRTFCTRNRVGIREEPDGTYAEFDSGGKRYEVNVAPSSSYLKNLKELGRTPEVQELGDASFEVAMAAFNQPSLAPDSEEERNLQEEESAPPNAQIPRPDFSRRGSEDEDDEQRAQSSDEEENEDRCWLDPPQQSTYVPDEQSPNGDSFEIEAELQESYIRMIQKGGTNAEWDNFCRMEKRRKKKDKDAWNKWKKSKKNSIEEDETEIPEAEPPDPQPSETLATMDPRPEPPSRRLKAKSTPFESEVTVVRRSRRVARDSRKEHESGYLKKLRDKRKFERNEKLTKRSMSTKNCTIPDAVLASFGAAITREAPVEEEPTGPMSSDDGTQSFSTIDSKTFQEYANRWPPVGDCEELTYREENMLVRERRIENPPRSTEEAVRVRPFDESMNGWRIGPGDHTFDETKIYPWISKAEMRTVLKWVKSLPGSGLKHFFVHAICNEGLAVTLTPTETNMQQTLEELDDARILEMWRGVNGDWIAIPKHSVLCASQEANRIMKPCQCEQGGRLAKAFRIERTPEEESSTTSEGSPRITDWNDAEENLEDPEEVPTTVGSTPEDNEPYEAEEAEVVSEEPADGEVVTHPTNDPHPSDAESDDPLPSPLSESESDPCLEDWTRDDGVFEERNYACGKSKYTNKNVAALAREDMPEDDMRPIDEAPSTGKVLGKDGTYKEEETYPKITQAELIQIIAWCDSLKENQAGGKRFLIYRTRSGTIAVSEMKSEEEREKRKGDGDRLLELTRTETGQLTEVPGRRTGSREEFPKISRPNSERSATSIYEEEEVPRLDEDKGPELSNAGDKRVMACKITRDLEQNKESPEAVPENPQDENDEDEPRETRGVPEMDGHRTPRPRVPMNQGLAKELWRRFPARKKIEYLPVSDNPGNGLLAARQIIPLARYDDQEDVSFYARGVTLSWTEGQDDVHFQGNALIRVTQRDARPQVKPPSRRRTLEFRKKLFRLESFSKETVQKDITNEPGRAAEPNLFAESSQNPRGNDQSQAAVKPNEGTEEELARIEVGAVMDDLTTNPIDEIKGMRTYQILRHSNGIVTVERLPHDHPLARRFESEMELGEFSKEAEIKFEDTDAERLTEKGSDPPPSDDRLDEVRESSEKPQVENACEPMNKTPGLGPEPLKLSGKEPENKSSEREHEGEIKEQEEAYLREDSPLTPLNSSPDNPTPQSPNCSPPMSNKPPNIPPPRQLRSLATACETGSNQSNNPFVESGARHEGPVIEVPQCTEPHKPALIAVTHLVRIEPRGVAAQPNRSYFGYGATIVEEGPNGEALVHHGHILVHLYTQPFRSYPSDRPFPPGPRIDTMRHQLFRIGSTRRPPGFRPAEQQGNGNPARESQTEPEAAAVHPFAGGNERGAAGKSRLELEKNAAETLVSVLRERKRMQENLQFNERWYPQPQDDAQEKPDVVSKGAAPTPEKTAAKSDLRSLAAGGSLLAKTVLDIIHRSNNQSESKASGTDVPSDKNPPTYAQPSADPIDVEMDTEVDESSDAGSPPELLEYASGEDEPMGQQPSNEQPKEPDVPAAASNAIASSPTAPNPQANSLDKRGNFTQLPQGSMVEYCQWKRTLGPMRAMLIKGESWSSDAVRDVFEDLGFERWWFTLREEEAKTEGIDWAGWKKKTLAEWTKANPETIPTIVNWMMNDLEKVDKELGPRKVFAVRKESQQHEDIDMVNGDAPKAPYPSPISHPNTSPPSTDPNDMVPYEAEAYENKDVLVLALADRIRAVEKTVAETTKDLNDSVKAMEDQMKIDTARLTDLGWRTTALENGEPSRGRSMETTRRGGKMTARGQARHRYATRYSAAGSDETATVTKKDQTSIERKLKRMEERLEQQRKEVKELREEIAKVEALAPKIAELSAHVAKLRTNQIEWTADVSQDITRLRARVEGEFDPVILKIMEEIALLHNRCNALQLSASPYLDRPPSAARIPFNPKSPFGINPNVTPYFLPPSKDRYVHPLAQSFTASNENRQLPPIRKTIVM